MTCSTAGGDDGCAASEAAAAAAEAISATVWSSDDCKLCQAESHTFRKRLSQRKTRDTRQCKDVWPKMANKPGKTAPGTIKLSLLE